MKTRRHILLTGWSLVFITGAAGLGVTHLYEKRFSSSMHLLVGALGQLVALFGLCLLALYIEKKKTGEKHPGRSRASS